MGDLYIPPSRTPRSHFFSLSHFPPLAGDYYRLSPPPEKGAERKKNLLLLNESHGVIAPPAEVFGPYQSVVHVSNSRIIAVRSILALDTFVSVL